MLRKCYTALPRFKEDHVLKVIRILMVASLLTLLSATVLNATNDTMRSIFVTIDGERQHFSTNAETIAEFFERAGIEINEGDIINVELTDLVVSARGVRNAPAREVIIERGFSITVNYESFSRKIAVPPRTTGNDIAVMISREGQRTYTFEGDGTQVLEAGGEYNLLVNISGRLLRPQPDSRVFDTDTYVIQYVSDPYEIEVLPTFSMSVGEETVIREGVEGKRAVLYRIGYLNNVEQFKDVIHENIIIEMVPKIVERGIAGMQEEDRSRLNIVRRMEMSASAYTARFECTGRHPGDPGFGITATGVSVRPGIVAVDPSVIPLGTKLYVVGYGYSIAADTGGAIRGYRIDLFFESLDDALAFGRRNIIVYVLAD